MLLLDYFCLLGAVSSLGQIWSSLSGHLFSSSSFFAYYNLTNRNQQHPTSHQLLGFLPFIYPLKSPQIKSQKLSAAGIATPLPGHEAHHSHLLQSSPLSSHLGLKQKHTLIIIVFKRNQNFKFLSTFPSFCFKPLIVLCVVESYKQRHFPWNKCFSD